MGQAAMRPGAIDALPEVIDEATARVFCGACFDDADWETLSGEGGGKLAKNVFKTVVKVRSHAPSMRTWLEFWRIDELTEDLEELQVMCADDLLDIEPEKLAAFERSIKVVQRVHWQKAMAHARYLKANPVGYMPWRYSALRMWLESWRLGRLEPALRNVGVDVKEDLLDLDDDQWVHLDLRLLERKRFTEAKENISRLLKGFNFVAQRKASVTTLPTWLSSLALVHLAPRIEALGAFELMDLADVDDATLKSMKLTNLQHKHWKLGVNQILAAKREAMADGKADLPTLRGYLESWRLLRLHARLVEMGTVSQQDLLDLEPDDYALLQMRPLEGRRFDQMMAALEEEFETPPPGEEWNETNMTRRQWRKQQAESGGFTGKKVQRAQTFRELNAVTQAKVSGKHLKNKFTKSQLPPTPPGGSLADLDDNASLASTLERRGKDPKATRMNNTAGSPGSRSGRY